MWKKHGCHYETYPRSDGTLYCEAHGKSWFFEERQDLNSLISHLESKNWTKKRIRCSLFKMFWKMQMETCSAERDRRWEWREVNGTGSLFDRSSYYSLKVKPQKVLSKFFLKDRLLSLVFWSEKWIALILRWRVGYEKTMGNEAHEWKAGNRFNLNPEPVKRFQKLSTSHPLVEMQGTVRVRHIPI